MWGIIGRAGLALLKSLFTSKTVVAAGAAAAGAAVVTAAAKPDKPGADKDKDDGGIAGWLSKTFMKHGLGIDTDKMDWKQGLGMLVVGAAVASMGRSMLGDNMISTVASLALGMAAAFGFSNQIKEITDGIGNFFNDASGAAGKKPDTVPAVQQRQALPAPAPAPTP